MTMMKKATISPSMMCIDFTDMRGQIEQLTAAGVEYFHMDIMDGHFVPNLMLCGDVVRAMRTLADVPFDYHFMVERPENVLPLFDIRQGDIVSIHIESTPHIQKAIQYIHQKGAKAFIAINPGTSATLLDAVMYEIDGVLVMTVNPGFAGQKLVESALPKICTVREMLDVRGKYDCSVEVDGNVSLPNAERMRSYGADIFVAGTSSVFQKDISLSQGVRNLRDAIARGERE